MTRDAIEQIQINLTWVSDDTLLLMIADLVEHGFRPDCTVLQAYRGLLDKRRLESESGTKEGE